MGYASVVDRAKEDLAFCVRPPAVRRCCVGVRVFRPTASNTRGESVVLRPDKEAAKSNLANGVITSP